MSEKFLISHMINWFIHDPICESTFIVFPLNTTFIIIIIIIIIIM